MTLNDSNQEKVINISEEGLQRAGWVFSVIAVLFIIIGYFASPKDEFGKPILLLPDVKQVEEYRKSARSWIVELSELDGEIAHILSTDQSGDLFSQSRYAQSTLQHAVELAQEIDQTAIPPIGVGIHEQFLSTSLAYLEAARSAMQWISAPQQNNQDTAITSLNNARTLREELKDNEWINSQ